MFPMTYVTLSDLLLHYWDSYDPIFHPFQEVKFFLEESSSIRRMRILMETFDCMDLGTCILI